MATPKLLPPLVSGVTFMETPIPTPTPLLQGIVDTGGKLAIGGGSKAHKSWIFTDLALAVASGTDWLGFKTQPMPQAVLYMNFEIPAFHFQRRLEAVAAAKGITVPDTLWIWNLRGHACNYVSLEQDIIGATTKTKAALVVTDPLYKIMGDTDENSASDMAKLFNSLERVANQTGAATGYAGHFSKGNQASKQAIDRVSGSGVHGRDPDAIINFTPHKTPDAYAVDVILRCYPPIPSFVVRWEHPRMLIDKDLDPAVLKAAGGPPKKYSVLDLLVVLKLRGGVIKSKGEFKELTCNRTGMSESTFKKLLEALGSHPEVLATTNGEWHHRPSNGEATV
jgi:hypothetical protein